jgi:malonyl-CoA/methylmalonyl-CoA synthetase
MLLPHLDRSEDRPAITVAGASMTHRELFRAAARLAGRLGDASSGSGRVAIWATPSLETCVGVIAAVLMGATAVPLNPKLGVRELDHVLRDCEPSALVASDEDVMPVALEAIPRFAPDLYPEGGSLAALPPEPGDDLPAFVFYTSGTTGPPKGVLMPRRAIASNLDALAQVWRWTDDDVLTHGLPLFHVHGLILGILGPLRAGGVVRHIGRFEPGAIRDEFARGATMMFGVPTMYHALAEASEQDPATADALRGARLLVSGSAPLPLREWHRIERATGQRIAERYGLTETIMNTAVRVDGDRTPGSVGPPLPGIDLRLLGDDGRPIEPGGDPDAIGEVVVRGPNVFLGYLNRPDATVAVMRGDWFHTGDLATWLSDGSIRIVGRRATDLIKTGGYKVGAGEVEAALLEHPAVAEAAVTGDPDAAAGGRAAGRGARPGPPPRGSSRTTSPRSSHRTSGPGRFASSMRFPAMRWGRCARHSWRRTPTRPEPARSGRRHRRRSSRDLAVAASQRSNDARVRSRRVVPLHVRVHDHGRAPRGVDPAQNAPRSVAAPSVVVHRVQCGYPGTRGSMARPCAGGRRSRSPSPSPRSCAPRAAGRPARRRTHRTHPLRPDRRPARGVGGAGRRSPRHRLPRARASGPTRRPSYGLAGR